MSVAVEVLPKVRLDMISGRGSGPLPRKPGKPDFRELT
jgi:hypothetical protein